MAAFQDRKPILQTRLRGLGAGFSFEQERVDH